MARTKREETPERRAQRERTRVIGQLVTKLPEAWRERIRAQLRAAPDPALRLELALVLAAERRAMLLDVYGRECEWYDRRIAEAKALRAQAEDARDERPEYAAALVMQATELERIQPDHCRYNDTLTRLDESERRGVDSLMLHRPSGHARVDLRIVGGAAMFGADPDDGYQRLSSPHDAGLDDEAEPPS